jgi:hypothetical protein
MLPLLESILTKVNYNKQESLIESPTAFIEKGQSQHHYVPNN